MVKLDELNIDDCIKYKLFTNKFQILCVVDINELYIKLVTWHNYGKNIYFKIPINKSQSFLNKCKLVTKREDRFHLHNFINCVIFNSDLLKINNIQYEILDINIGFFNINEYKYDIKFF